MPTTLQDSFLLLNFFIGREAFDPDPSPIAQMADIGFKVVLLERLNQKWKQKHF